MMTTTRLQQRHGWLCPKQAFPGCAPPANLTDALGTDPSTASAQPELETAVLGKRSTQRGKSAEVQQSKPGLGSNLEDADAGEE